MRRLLLPAILTGIFLLIVLAPIYAQTPPPAHSYKVAGEAGWPELTFALERVDLWPILPDGKHPQKGMFVVLVGDLTAGERASCLFKRNYQLNIGEQVFKTPETDAIDSIEVVYKGRDYPWSMLGSCPGKGQTKQIFLWFDVSNLTGPAVLVLDNGGAISIADAFEDMIVASGMSGFPTPTQTPTSTPTRSPTKTKTPSVAASPTKLPTVMRTSTPTPIGVTRQTATVLSDANLRSGPGTTFDVVGGVKVGDKVVVVGKNNSGDWYELDTGEWMATFLVEITGNDIHGASVPTTETRQSVLVAPVPTAASPINQPLTNGIAFGEPVVFDSGGFATVGVLATNTTGLVKTFMVKATYKNGDQILATAIGAINDLLPSQTRAVTLLSQDDIPAVYETVRVDVDTLVREAATTSGATAAQTISFGPPSVTGSAGFFMLNVEVTNNDTSSHTFTVQATFLQGNKLVGIGSGAVNDLAPGQTKTATLLLQGSTESADIQLAVDALIK